MNTLLEMQMPVLEPMLSPKAAKPVKKKILLMDDDAAMRQILLRLLQEEGYFVLTAANGMEALTLADATNFDLVMLDINQPAKDGWSTFEKLSAKEPTLPVIVVTARPSQFFPALDSGPGALLEKPLDFVKLFDTVRNLLEEPEDFRVTRTAGQSAMFRFVSPGMGGVMAGKAA